MGRGGLFQKAAIPLKQDLSNAPWALIMCQVQAEKATFAAETLLWGCRVRNFRAKLPFNGMRQAFCGLLKEAPTALPALF